MCKEEDLYFFYEMDEGGDIDLPVDHSKSIFRMEPQCHCLAGRWQSN